MKTLDEILFAEKDFFVIAEIGHNHQGSVETARRMIEAAKECGADAVKFQKRNNRKLFTRQMYARLYDNENSFGRTYGEHREALEFGEAQYRDLLRCAKRCGIMMFSTAFDRESVDFLERMGNPVYKLASADLDNEPLIEYVAKKGKPVLFSTGAGSLEEVKRAYRLVRGHSPYPPVVMQCTSIYPMSCDKANLRTLEFYKRLFPDAVLGYSGHEVGILLPVLAYMLGARVIEKHFTLNRAMKGTDHKFSLEPAGLKKLVRDLHRCRESLGTPAKPVFPEEKPAKEKMGKSLYIARGLRKGHVLREADLCVKSPAGGLPPGELTSVVGRSLRRDMKAEEQLLRGDLRG